MPDRVIQLSISEGGSESGAMFTFHLDLDGTVLASNQGLTVPQSQAVRELSFRYGLLTDQVELDFEREEDLLLSALGRTGRRVVFDSGDLGSFEELGDRINEFRPHIVHLTGHGVTRDETAYFAFEDERGDSDRRSASE